MKLFDLKILLISAAIAAVLTGVWWYNTHTPVELVYRNDETGEIVGHPHFDVTVETIHDAGKCDFIVFAEDDPSVEGPPCVEWRVYNEETLGWQRFRGPASAMPRGAVPIGALP